MAKMIPSGYNKSTPYGERELFERLRDDPNTQGWVVMHSLDLRTHERKREAEIDMVVLVPDWGVLCIEVKGSDVRRDENGIWDYGYQKKYESPFKQASTAMHALHKYVTSRDVRMSHLLFFSAVIFTGIEFNEQTPEWHSWQCVSKSRFKARPVSEIIIDILGRAHHHIKDVLKAPWYQPQESRPSINQIDALMKLLRPQFGYSVSPKDELRATERMITHFTEEQFGAIDSLEENNRVVLKGPAGTGKTFLALEVVRRSLAKGERVLFICFNRFLGDWLENIFGKDKGEHLYCGTLHRLLLDCAGIDSPDNITSARYWSEELPEIAINRLLESSDPNRTFDMLVIDEAQDILSSQYLAILDLMVSGGLQQGRWCFFGDYEKQAIYREDSASEIEADIFAPINAYAKDYVNYALRKNCRNARPISDLLTLTCDLQPGYRSVLHDTDFATATPYFYNSEKAQQEKIKDLIELELTHFDYDEIVVLSTRNSRSSCVGSGEIQSGRFGLVNFKLSNSPKSIRHSSIHAFKGLEASVVILTDIDQLGGSKMNSVLYVGMSRAKVRLYVLMHESCRSEWNSMLDDGLLI
jgi:hypothetical protein